MVGVEGGPNLSKKFEKMAQTSKPKLPSERKKPGPKPWATEPQECRLMEGVPGYRQAQAKKPKRNAISKFLDDFMPTWWAEFPLREGVTAAADRASANGSRITVPQKKIAGGVSVRDIFPRNSRALKAEELYSRKYYQTRVKPLVEDKKEEGSTQGQILNLVKAMTKEVFAQESEEIREEILIELKNQLPIKPTVGEEMTPEMFAAALKSAPG
ncbi:hypothetical protein ARMSODRAFT_1020271 [Armillaria solidipes]|uniref:Uncharacterized protein n=1 Tax=Armillaria solidipes TaxID=1076256 RepID=A0A2H3BFR1_9AGAR|nr:hypothetical protein ARMSODRAFT_1020271 [Armillaria solidipes]